MENNLWKICLCGVVLLGMTFVATIMYLLYDVITATPLEVCQDRATHSEPTDYCKELLDE